MHSLLFSQGDPVPKIRQALTKYYRNYPQEKVYLHCDKQSYYSSETIWFSGYVTYQCKPSTISYVLYAELFNDKGLIIDRAMLHINKGMVAGDFLLPADLPAGNYYIRAYTAWMLNFNSALFFYCNISVKDKRQKEKPVQSPGKSEFSVQFFPESGQLVSRLTSLVAFKAVDTNGVPVAVRGKVFNNLGDTVAAIKTVHDGMGNFVLHCTPQTTYTALITANGITKKIPLPIVQTEGIVLHTELHDGIESDSVFFHVSRSGINKEKFEHLILCAQMENRYSVAKLHFSESVFNDPFDTTLTAPYPLLSNNFGDGLLRLSVLNEAGNVLAERLIFLHKARSSNIKVDSLMPAIGKERKVSILMPEDYHGSVAVSVTDASNEIDTTNFASIKSELLLSGNLSTPVFNAGWYFNSNTGTKQALNLLMLTSKSAKPSIQSILNDDEQRIKYLPEKSLTLKGQAFEVNGNNTTALKNGSLFLMLKAKIDAVSTPLLLNTDSAGLFNLPDLNFHDSAVVYVQANANVQSKAAANYAVEFYKNIFDSIARNRYVVAPFVLNTNFYSKDTQAIAENSFAEDKTSMLKNVTITAKVKTHLDSVLATYTSGLFANPGVWVQTIDLTNDPITINSDQAVLEWLNGKAPGLNYTYNNGKPIIYWRYSNVIAGLSAMDQLKLNAPAFFLNENLLSAGLEGYDASIDLLSGIRMADVALIRIFKPGTLSNVPDNGPHGAIAIYLRNGKEMDKPTKKLSFEQSIKIGYKTVHRFKEQDAGEHGTLYWNPSVAVDPITHIASFSFPGIVSKQLRIVVEGLDEKGNIISINRLFQNNIQQ
ncbi:MAG: hypothetical protein QM726_24785 [Chitinophagaceae bacterium]